MAEGPGRDAGVERPQLSGRAGPLTGGDERAIEAAVAALEAGRLVAFPTETVYGLGADAERDAAVARVFAAKRRPTTHPLIVHGAGPEILDRYAASAPPLARRLAELWPAPLTLILPRAAGVAEAASGGLPTVALRVPDQPLALEMLARLGRGVAAPSANRFGRVSPTCAEDVVAELGDAVAVVLDGGRCRVGVESTIVDLSGERPTLVRPGALDVEDLAAAIGMDLVVDPGHAPAPGTLSRHYQPLAEVELVDLARLEERATELAAAGHRVAVMGPGPRGALPTGTVELPPVETATDYAYELYAQMRAADIAGASRLLATPPPPGGLAPAVIDRLRRAAGPDATGT